MNASAVLGVSGGRETQAVEGKRLDGMIDARLAIYIDTYVTCTFRQAKTICRRVVLTTLLSIFTFHGLANGPLNPRPYKAAPDPF